MRGSNRNTAPRARNRTQDLAFGGKFRNEPVAAAACALCHRQPPGVLERLSRGAWRYGQHSSILPATAPIRATRQRRAFRGDFTGACSAGCSLPLMTLTHCLLHRGWLQALQLSREARQAVYALTQSVQQRPSLGCLLAKIYIRK